MWAQAWSVTSRDPDGRHRPGALRPSGRTLRLTVHASAIRSVPTMNATHAVASLDTDEPVLGARAIDAGSRCPAAAAMRVTARVADETSVEPPGGDARAMLVHSADRRCLTAARPKPSG